ncbi:MAG: LysR family transcriptional regulator [Ruminococcus sp.]|nr:LysR family transcriptional regulator [Ruminococcus sp.]
MKIQQLEYVIAIAQEGSITHAAKKLFQAQPNISIALKELEGEIGTQIFSRTSSGMILTPEGENFVAKATSIVNDMHSLEREYITRNTNDICANIGICRSGYLTAAIGNLLSEYSESEDCERMDIHITETDTFNVLNGTCSGKYDIGVIRVPDNYESIFAERTETKKLNTITLLEYNLYVCIKKDHPLAEYDDIPFTELVKYPEIYNGNNELEMLRRAALNPAYDDSLVNKRIHVYDRGSQLSMISTIKDAYMWIPPIDSDVFHGLGLVIRKCSFAKNLNKDVVIYRKSNEDNPLITNCIEKLLEHTAMIKKLNPLLKQ